MRASIECSYYVVGAISLSCIVCFLCIGIAISVQPQSLGVRCGGRTSGRAGRAPEPRRAALADCSPPTSTDDSSRLPFVSSSICISLGFLCTSSPKISHRSLLLLERRGSGPSRPHRHAVGKHRRRRPRCAPVSHPRVPQLSAPHSRAPLAPVSEPNPKHGRRDHPPPRRVARRACAGARGRPRAGADSKGLHEPASTVRFLFSA
jgi:hypothetical protein